MSKEDYGRYQSLWDELDEVSRELEFSARVDSDLPRCQFFGAKDLAHPPSNAKWAELCVAQKGKLPETWETLRDRSMAVRYCSAISEGHLNATLDSFRSICEGICGVLRRFEDLNLDECLKPILRNVAGEVPSRELDDYHYILALVGLSSRCEQHVPVETEQAGIWTTFSKNIYLDTSERIRNLRPKLKRVEIERTTRARKPSWNSDTRELKVGDELIKKYRQTAVPQCCILSSFQEEKWPKRIYDPLPTKERKGRTIDPKKRVRDTVRALNTNHKTPNLLKFRSDGTGEGITWELTKEVE